jgi:mono/diheme cytochrome c family protein
MMKPCARVLAAALVLLESGGAVLAQNLENGQRLSERWCGECHDVGTVPGKSRGAPPFAAIAVKEGITSDMIASFLLLPHATMPNFPLSRDDERDIAAFILEMKK